MYIENITYKSEPYSELIYRIATKDGMIAKMSVDICALKQVNDGLRVKNKVLWKLLSANDIHTISKDNWNDGTPYSKASFKIDCLEHTCLRMSTDPNGEC